MKNYTKPEIMFDSFELSENIASCAYLDTATSGQGECQIIDTETGWVIFTVTNGCSQTPEDGLNICYEVPFEGYNVFVS